MGKDSKHSGGREIWAVVLVVLSLLLLFSLISYNPYDVGHISASEHRSSANFIGPVGAWIAFGTFQAFGLAAGVLMVVLAVIGVMLLLGKELPWRSTLGAGALLVVSSSCMFHVWGLGRAVHALNLPDSAGGFLGLFVGGFFQQLVGKIGTWIIFIGCYIIGLILLINFRPSYWVALTVGTATDFWQRRHKGKSKSSVEDELRDQERELTIKEFKTDREVARQEKEARKLAATKSNGEKSNGDEDAEKVRRPEPKFEDYTVSRPQNGADKKKTASGDAPSLVEKIADKLKPKKDDATGTAAAASSTESEAAGATPTAPKPPRKAAPATVLGTVHAASGEAYLLPELGLLEQPPLPGKRDVMDDLKTSARILRETLQEFGIEVESGDVTKGPTVTLFELYPAAGVRVEKISSLSNNIAMAMRAEKVRILAPVPGKGTVGIEVPNTSRTTVYLRDMLDSEEWRSSTNTIPVALGRDVKGNPIIGDLANMPHLLIAGATGSGKTVCVNAILASLLYRFTAEDLRLVLIDPKMVEMQHFNALPHLIVPVVTEAKKVPLALGWVIREMEKRFQIFAKSGVRNIASFNTRPKKSVVPEVETPVDDEEPTREKPEYTTNSKPTPKAEQEVLKIEVPRDFELIIPEKLPYIVVVCDELADLMTTVGKDVEMAISRLTALGRAAGIHLVIATQRPSVNVVTGVIKANIPARIAFQVASMQDSRVILDSQGAEKLLGKGDMLYEPGSGKAVRAQGVLVLDKEITRIVDFIGAHAKPQFEQELAQKLKRNVNLPDGDASEEDEELVEQCIEVIRQTNRASVSVLQRRLRIGYTRAARIMDLLEERGIVGPNKGAEPREILIDLDEQMPAEK